MPLYEYCCKDCGAEFEEIVPVARADQVVCNVCGSKKIERLASSFSCSIKTSGSQASGAFCEFGG